MPTREFHRVLLTSRIAHFSGLLWLLLFVTQWVIAIHDNLSYPETMINYRSLDTSAEISLWALALLALLNVWAVALRAWWRGELPPFLSWLIAYNVRVAVLWGITVAAHGVLLQSPELPGHAWLATHLSLGYALASSPSLLGAVLLVTRRWAPSLSRPAQTDTHL